MKKILLVLILVLIIGSLTSCSSQEKKFYFDNFGKEKCIIPEFHYIGNDINYNIDGTLYYYKKGKNII